jgi:HEAT repeat protein
MSRHTIPEGKTMRLMMMMTTSLLCGVLLTGVAAAVDDPVAVLQSDAAYELKAEACRDLVRTGGEGAVPVLAALLTDQKLSHMARLALETMPYPSVDEALRDALATTSGDLQVGMINSLGNRADEAAVPALGDLLASDNMEVVQAAGRALGQIPTEGALDALAQAARKGGLDEPATIAVCEGLFEHADRAAKNGNASVATEIYAEVAKAGDAPAAVRVAALRVAVLAQGDAGLPLLMDAIRTEDEALFDAALRTGQEYDAEGATAALSQELAALSPSRKIRLMEVLGQRDDDAAGDALMAEAKAGETEVRIAALKALTRLAYTPVLDVVAELLSSEDALLADAAREVLCYFPGDAGDAALHAMLQSDDAAKRKLAIELVGRGGLPKPVDLLVEVANADADAGVRVAALTALRTFAGVEQIPTLLDHVVAPKSVEERDAAENALTALCTRLQQSAGGEVAVVEAVYGDLPNGEQANVTEKVAELVAGGKRSIDASNGLFGDTAPGTPKQLRITFTINGVQSTKVAPEGTAIALSADAVPATVTEAFFAAYEKAEGEARPAMLRLLGSTASSAALEEIVKVATSGEGMDKETAVRELSEWPTLDALDAVLALAANGADARDKVLGLRGAVRLLRQSGYPTADLLAHYAKLMDIAESDDGRKLVLSAIGDLGDMAAFEMALSHAGDEAVRAEALQAATAIAGKFGEAAREDTAFFNGTDLTGWSGPEGFWSVVDGAIVGTSDTQIPRNTFVWADGEQGDFYLVLDVKLEPNTANAGIQIRSKKVDDYGQAEGYQADMGAEVWGRLYHEHGRGKLFWDGRAEAAVKPGDWNRYEILAVGPAIWTAINGQLGVSFLDPAPERTGQIAFQIHGGPPQTASYRIVKLVHNPKVEMEGLDTATLVGALNGGGSE